ncbi:MAG: hypothetical protein AB8H79_00960 [Myxococcota bacterium]
MIPRHAALLAVLAIPAVAFGTTWGSLPTSVWLPQELNWAANVQIANLTIEEIEDDFAPPPRAGWCSAAGLEYTPNATECDDYDDALEAWMLDFTDTSEPANLPTYWVPSTYCGGC